MKLRVLTASERGNITELFRDVFIHEPWLDDWSDRAQLDAYIDDLTGQRNSLALGFFDGERLAALSLGFVKHWFAGTEYVIDEFCVDRNRQGKGTGTAFLAAIEAYLREHGIFRIFLQTGKDMPAYAFYLKNGFRELEGHVSFSKEIG